MFCGFVLLCLIKRDKGCEDSSMWATICIPSKSPTTSLCCKKDLYCCIILFLHLHHCLTFKKLLNNAKAWLFFWIHSKCFEFCWNATVPTALQVTDTALKITSCRSLRYIKQCANMVAAPVRRSAHWGACAHCKKNNTAKKKDPTGTWPAFTSSSWCRIWLINTPLHSDIGSPTCLGGNPVFPCQSLRCSRTITASQAG